MPRAHLIVGLDVDDPKLLQLQIEELTSFLRSRAGVAAVLTYTDRPPDRDRPIRLSASNRRVAIALLQLEDEDPDRVYGLQVMRLSGLASSQVYPVLTKLTAAGWLTVRKIDRAQDRPPRVLYSITDSGRAGLIDLTTPQ